MSNRRPVGLALRVGALFLFAAVFAALSALWFYKGYEICGYYETHGALVFWGQVASGPAFLAVFFVKSGVRTAFTAADLILAFFVLFSCLSTAVFTTRSDVRAIAASAFFVLWFGSGFILAAAMAT